MGLIFVRGRILPRKHGRTFVRGRILSRKHGRIFVRGRIVSRKHGANIRPWTNATYLTDGFREYSSKLFVFVRGVQFCHSWVFSCVCWAFACKALFQLRLLSFQRLCLSFYSNMAIVPGIVLYYGAIKRSSWHSSSLHVAKGCSPTVGVIVLPSLKLRG